MSKTLKNSKQVLAFVLAFAVIAVSMFTGFSFKASAATEENVVYYNWSSDKSFTTDGKHGSGIETDPYIISTPDQLLAVAKNEVATEGKYFKVADDVDALVLQSKSKFEKTFESLKNSKLLLPKRLKQALPNPEQSLISGGAPVSSKVILTVTV